MTWLFLEAREHYFSNAGILGKTAESNKPVTSFVGSLMRESPSYVEHWVISLFRLVFR